MSQSAANSQAGDSNVTAAKTPRAVRSFLLGNLLLHAIAAALLFWMLTGTVRRSMIHSVNEQLESIGLFLTESIRQLPLGIGDDSVGPQLQRYSKKSQIQISIIDPDGMIVADTVEGNIGLQQETQQPEILAANPGQPGFAERTTEFSASPLLLVAHEIEAGDQHPGGFVRVARSKVEIERAVGRIRRNILILMGSLALASFALSSWFLSHLLDPLAQFSAVAKRIGGGDYDDLPTFLSRKDEWGSLADAFRQMQAKLTSREQTLTENRDQLAAVLRSMIEGVVAIDSDGRVRIANRAACRMLSLTESEIVDRNLQDMIRNPKLSAAVEQTRSAGKLSKVEFETIGDDARRQISARVSVLSDSTQPDQKPPIVAVLHDVTELRQLENMRRDFVANVSHELKTPLTSIKACAETLKLGAIDDSSRNLHFVDQIESNADLLDQQIHELLQLARVESGRQNWSIEELSISELCRQCVVNFASEAESRNVKLRFLENDHEIIADGDYEALTTILKNLIGNALRYTPAQGLVAVSTDSDQTHFELVVSDTGIGISEEHQSRIFERFYRVDEARSRDQGGTGLGLAIVKHIVQAFGGKVEVESKINAGSVFRVRIPIE